MTTARQELDRHVSEKDFRQQVLDYARLQGWQCYFSWSSIHSPAGYPDLTMVRPPRVIYAELKSENGKATDAQLDWLRLFDACDGVVAFLWRPHDWPEIEKVLARE